MPKPFLAQDSRGAEVRVTTIPDGVISKIEENEKNKLARVTIRSPRLKKPDGFNCRMEDDTYPTLVRLYENEEVGDFRIESQRKKNIDPALPLDEVDNDDRKRVLAAVNGQLTSEALTNPADDPEDNSAPVSVLSQQRQSQGANASTNGGNAQEAQQNANNGNQASRQPQNNNSNNNQNNHSGGNYNGMENAPTQRMNNTPNGAVLNIGSYAVQASTSAETFAFGQLAKDRDFTVLMEHQDYFIHEAQRYGLLILSIVDTLQARYTGFNVNRMASSHTRLRGIVFQVIDHVFPISLVLDKKMGLADWYKNVGVMSNARFNGVGMLVNSEFNGVNLDQLLDNGDGSVQRGQNQAQNQVREGQNGSQEASTANGGATAPSVQDNGPQGQQTVQENQGQSNQSQVNDGSDPAFSANKVSSARPDAAQGSARPGVNQESAPTEDTTSNDESSSEEANANALSNLATSVEVYGKVDISGMEIVPEEIQQVQNDLRELMTEAGLSGDELYALLEHSFNVGNVHSIPAQELSKFYDFYIDRELAEAGYCKKAASQIIR